MRGSERGGRFSNTLITALGLKFVQLVFPSRRELQPREDERERQPPVEMLKSEETFISFQSIINIPGWRRSTAGRVL